MVGHGAAAPRTGLEDLVFATPCDNAEQTWLGSEAGSPNNRGTAPKEARVAEHPQRLGSTQQGQVAAATAVFFRSSWPAVRRTSLGMGKLCHSCVRLTRRPLGQEMEGIKCSLDGALSSSPVEIAEGRLLRGGEVAEHDRSRATRLCFDPNLYFPTLANCSLVTFFQMSLLCSPSQYKMAGTFFVYLP